MARFRIVVNEPLPPRARAVAEFDHVETTPRGTLVVYTAPNEALMEFPSLARFLEEFEIEREALVPIPEELLRPCGTG
jgi:hypothetical protein